MSDTPAHIQDGQFRTVYHGVFHDDTLPAIQSEGLRPMRLKEVYTSPDFKTAAGFSKRHVVEVGIHPSQIIAEEPGSVVSGPIPPGQIRKVHTRSDNETWHDYWKNQRPS
jgi:RNA:NAD 2'-phosphotransferase (TPT1/KptA family)